MRINFNSAEPALDESHDTTNIRYNATYEIEVAKDVFWVPVNILGSTRYSNDDMKALIKNCPAEKQKKINTLYEAIQLYQVSRFTGIIDIIDCHGRNYYWQFSKPGYHAVRTNEGCCATDSNWLSYILKGSYEQIGFLNYSQKNTSGHVTNYIFHEGWYYFIDMMMYREDSLQFSGIETGTQGGYKDGAFISGNFHKTRSPLRFVEYCLSNFKERPVIFFLLQQEENEAIGVRFRTEEEVSESNFYMVIENGYNLVYPKGSSALILYKDNESSVEFSFECPPSCLLDWQSLPDYQF